MNLYLLSQSVNNDYDTFDAVIVCAESELEARKIHPYGDGCDATDPIAPRYIKEAWVEIKDVHVTLIGVANPGVPKGVVLASFNGG